MSISIHIPFYNPNPEKKEGYRNLRRFDYLEENVINLKTDYQLLETANIMNDFLNFNKKTVLSSIE